MADENKFALVPRPPGAVEKVEPGAKHILFGMVADTLALAKKEPPCKSRPPRIVVVNDNPPVLHAVEAMIRHWSKEVALQLFQYSVEAWQELSRTNPDLLIWVVSAPLLRGKEIVQRLMDRKVTYPIVVISAFHPDELWVQEFASRGLNVSFLPMPFTFESLRKLMEAGLKIPRDTIEKPSTITLPLHRTRPPHIVVVDDDDDTSKLIESLIRDQFKDATVLLFRYGEAALQELLQVDPDLLISDLIHFGVDGFEMLRLLAERQAKYPIFIVSGNLPLREKEAKQCAGTDLNVTFWTKPFSNERFMQYLIKQLVSVA